MEYQVPQFIEVEDKIVGPLTLKQFIYLAGGAGLAVVIFFYLSFIFWLILAVPIIALSVTLAFYKMNGKPFIEILEAGFSYYVGSKLFLWHKEVKKEKQQTTPIAEPIIQNTGPRLTSDKLHELAWSLDIKNSHQSGADKES